MQRGDTTYVYASVMVESETFVLYGHCLLCAANQNENQTIDNQIIAFK